MTSWTMGDDHLPERPSRKLATWFLSGSWWRVEFAAATMVTHRQYIQRKSHGLGLTCQSSEFNVNLILDGQ